VKLTKLILLIFSLLTTGLQAQNEPDFTFKGPEDDKAMKCKDYFETMASIPSEVRYTVIELDRFIYLVFNSRGHFELISEHKAEKYTSLPIGLKFPDESFRR